MAKELVARQIYQAINQAHKVLLVTHYGPDGDAAASLSAMTQILVNLKKDYTAFCADKFEDKVSWLPGLDLVVNRDSDIKFEEFDLIITLDCGSLARTRLAEKIKARRAYQKLAEIDHHEPLEKIADWELRLPEAASTTEVVYDWLKINHLPISWQLAEAILIGLVTDTGNFIYSATSEKSLRIAAEMLSRGASWPKLIKAASASANLATAKLWGLALSRLRVNRCYQVAFTVLTRADWEGLGLSEEATEDLPGFLSRLSDVRAILVLKDIGTGIVKGSWRSCQEGVDVAKLASYLGGGGHMKAAGFYIKGQLTESDGNWRIV